MLYEGINALCFSCGHVGHKVENCPYTTKALVNKDARKEDDKVDGHVSVASKCSEPSKEAYGPWVLVSRKKVFKKEKKDPAQQPPYGMAQLLKTRLPDQAESPIFFRPNLSVSEERDKPHDSKLSSEISVPATNCTRQTKATDKPRTTIHQSASKALSQNTRSNQRGRGASRVKEYRQKQTAESNSSVLGSDSDHRLINPMVFFAGSTMKAEPEPLPNVGISSLGDMGQGESTNGVGSQEMKVSSMKVPLRDISNQPPPLNKDMSDLVATTTLNVSAAELKHNDPMLKPSKKGSEVIPSFCSVREEDNMVRDESPKAPAQGIHEVDSDGMQIEGGGEPFAFN